MKIKHYNSYNQFVVKIQHKSILISCRYNVSSKHLDFKISSNKVNSGIKVQVFRVHDINE